MNLAQYKNNDAKSKLWAASYDLKRDAFRIAMENGKIFLLPRPIPEDDHSEILDVIIEGDGEIFTVVQASGNEFSVPWDVVERLATGEKTIHGTVAGERIGDNIKYYRKKKSLTQAQLCQLTGLTKRDISDLENGKIIPDIHSLELLAPALDVKLVDLILDRPKSH